MSKHTPGPWFVSGRMTKYVEARIGGNLIQEVAACGPTNADGGYGEQQHANARLISAAPDLLEALQSSKSLMESIGMQSSDEYQQASAAIAKALGEE